MRFVPGWKTGTLLLVVVAHGLLGWALARYRPDGRLPAVRVDRSHADVDVLTVLSFETRAETPRHSAVRPTRQPRRHPRDAASGRAGQAGEAARTVVGSGPAAPLDLRAPPPPPPDFAAHDPLRRRTPALEQTTTRFDGAWLSNGDLTQVAARRSKVAAVVLGALGALRKPCTARQRRDYDVACVPDQYRHVDADD